jgi:alginate O-acetyltransferase complex protein AlgI
MYFNLALVFVISGFWHGAAWNFLIWGAFHGIFLILDRLFLLKIYSIIGKNSSIIITFFITIIGWVIFRSTSIEQVIYYTNSLFSFSNSTYYIDNQILSILLLAIIFSFITILGVGQKLQTFIYYRNNYTQKEILVYSIIVLILFTLCASSLVSSSFNPFIYFRF